MRDAAMPVSMLMECELQVLELLEYKPIMSKGYTCMMHLHASSDDCFVKDILSAEEIDPTGKLVKKEAPIKFIRNGAKARVRISTRVPVPLEKFEAIPQLGRFTLRDEGKTIAVGTVLKYKPHSTEV